MEGGATKFRKLLFILSENRLNPQNLFYTYSKNGIFIIKRMCYLMKISKLLFLPLVLFTLTACNPIQENTKTSSTQTDQSKKVKPIIDTTEETIQKERINIDFIYGEWQSINGDAGYYMTIDKINDVTLMYSDNLERKDSQELKIEKVSKDYVTAITEDEKVRYNFTFSDDVLTASMGVNSEYYSKKGQEVPRGESKPIQYELVLKCGTEDVSTGFSDTLEEIPEDEENEDLP